MRFHSPTLFVSDIEHSTRFYTQVMGQVIDLDFGKNVILKCGITLWEVDPNNIIPKQLGIDRITNRQFNRFELYFETQNLDADFQKLEESGVTFLHEIHEEPWGQRTVRFFDPDNHLVELGETLGTFVKRLFNQGLTREQVTNRTSIPLETVNRLLG